MTSGIAYALVLFMHPGPETKIFAVFPTAQACRTERAQVIQDLGSSQIVAACVPQNQLSITDASRQMQEMLKNMQREMEKQGSK